MGFSPDLLLKLCLQFNFRLPQRAQLVINTSTTQTLFAQLFCRLPLSFLSCLKSNCLFFHTGDQRCLDNISVSRLLRQRRSQHVDLPHKRFCRICNTLRNLLFTLLCMAKSIVQVRNLLLEIALTAVGLPLLSSECAS